MALIQAQHLHLAYDRREIVRDLTLTLPEGRITIIVGANGSGKSTLLRGMSRLLAPRSGSVLLDGQDLHSLRGKELARRLGLLPQSPVAPDGVTVRELVTRGRFPHQGLFPQWSAEDERAVAEALAATRTDDLQDRLLEELSGGQRQRVWIAMALAQQTEVLLLDEPTTYLDVTHQLEVLDVVRDLNLTRGTTVGIVLHDLHLAARYADHLVAVRGGEIHSQGTPHEVITEQMAHEVFALDARIAPDPVTGTPMVLPLGRDRTATPHRQEDPVSATTARTTTAQTTTAQTAAAEAAEAVPALEHSSMLAFDLAVVARRPLGPSLVRFTLAGPDLAHFGTGSHPLDLRVKLIIPGPHRSADHFAPVRPGGMLDPVTQADWYRTWLQIDPSDRGWMRTYTVREQRAAGHPGNVSDHPEIDLDMVLHLDPVEVPGQGVAARWARDAQVGDAVTLLGPNRHLVGPEYGGIEFRPGTARTVLLVGDETAVPAVGSILEALPDSVSGHALLEVPHAEDEQTLLTRSGVQVTWLPREGRAHGELLDAEVRRVMGENAQAFRDAAVECPPAALRRELEDVDVDEAILWETTTGRGAFYAWLAGEAGVIKTLRRHLVSELGIDRKQVSFMGYWRAGRPEH
ncbi:SIP domain-containing protein [Brachybacterium saurashtrense]|uniref:Mycobactin import ATP-binding/permease protein IrtA n=1 Tax=Brachybacterium saurashtrense TaxID=556288 RepID=A0A345YQ63_9MICO|nr:SIP domain-containing protein [Brachybacterium saurashtrense]AXK46065.1 ATP-binding cassette domain-containing protein [Brachybacterium saurashtrense]RRR23805.1 ATP-binding cassette domain-containing protein [Brachybacterium saurashtrense]